MTSRKKILIISFTDHDKDPRVIRQIELLKKDYDLFTVGQNPYAKVITKHYRIDARKSDLLNMISRLVLAVLGCDKKLIYDKYNLKNIELNLLKEQFDLIICNDLEPSALAISIKRNAKLIFDAHEYYPGEITDRWWLKILLKNHVNRMLRVLFKHTDSVFTVSNGCANLYNQKFGVLPKVLMNVTDYKEITPVFNQTAEIKFVHHGIAARSRKIELMIETVIQCKIEATLDLYLVANSTDSINYLNGLKEKYKQYKYILFNLPIPINDISATINCFDVGLILIEPSQPNYQFGMPNKLFEFIQARIAVVSTPLVDLKLFIEAQQIGQITEGFTVTKIVETLNNINMSKVNTWKKRVDAVAKEFNAETEMKKLAKEIELLLKG